jgi:hypothetical protein
MSATVKKVNAWFKQALKSEIEKLRDDLSLTPRQDKIFELFYLKKKPIDVIADESNCCIMVINCELQTIRHKIIRVIDET